MVGVECGGFGWCKSGESDGLGRWGRWWFGVNFGCFGGENEMSFGVDLKIMEVTFMDDILRLLETTRCR